MDQDAPSVEKRLERLTSRLEAAEARLARLESQNQGVIVRDGRVIEPHAAVTPLTPLPPLAALRVRDVGSGIALVGRTLFILAGAFLLRALTDSGQLNAGPGVLVGLAFALTWIVMADRAGGRGARASAAFYGLAFVLIAFPLLYEATIRFQFLNAAVAVAAVGSCTLVALAVSWRGHLQALSWITTTGAVATAIALAVASAAVGPLAILLVVLGVATVWLGYTLEWTLLRWPVALFADFAVALLSLRAVAPGSADAPVMALAAQTALLLGYLGSFAVRTLLLNRNIIPFEIAQSIGAAVVGLGGAAFLARVTDAGRVPLGLATLVLAFACYGAAAIFVERRESRRRNYYFFTSAGLVLALGGAGLAMWSTTVGVVYAAFGVLAAWAGRLSQHITYRAHGAAYLLAAIIAAGLLPDVLYGLGVPLVPRIESSAPMLGVLVLCGISMWGLTPDPPATARTAGSRVPRLIVLVVAIGGLLGAIVIVALPPSTSPAALTPGLIATIRTALLVGAILSLALADRLWAFVEGAWLVYPLLILTGLKFLLEDVRAGRPATLVVGFALYGLALVVGPRLRRH